MTLADNTERIIEKMRLKTRAAIDERILRDAFTKFDKSSRIRSIKIEKGIKRSIFSTKLFKFVAVAAILIIFTSVSLIRFRARQAVPRQIYNALLRTENFSVSCYHSNNQEPFQKVWVSKSLGLNLFETSQANSSLLTLWDISNNNKLTSLEYSDSVEEETITDQMLTNLEESMVQAFSLGLFSNMKQIPKNATWKKINDQAVVVQVPNSMVFDLEWQHKISEETSKYYKWRMFVTENTNKIRRTELFVKNNPDEQYKLESYTIISYLFEEEIKSVIHDNFDTIKSKPVYRPTGGQ